MRSLLHCGLVAGVYSSEIISQLEITPCYDCEEGAVMGGYDTVQMFKSQAGSQGVKGSSSHTATYEGYTFWFSSASNLATFQDDPQKYVPAYGGF